MVARSKVQKAQARAAMAKINSGNKENIGSSSARFSDGNTSDSHNEASEALSALCTTCVRVLELKRLLHNTHHKLTHTEHSKVNLRAETKAAISDAENSCEKLGHAEQLVESLQKAKNTLRMCVNCALGKQKVAVEKAQSHYLKEKGVFKEAVWEMTRDLTSICCVPVAHIDSVIHTVAKGFGINVKDSMDKHSTSHITLEGQVTVDMQLVHEIHNTGGKSIFL